MLVGHSILFRALCARLLAAAPPAPPDPAQTTPAAGGGSGAPSGGGGGGGGAAAVERNRPGLAEHLRRGRKLANGAVLAVTVVFPGPAGGGGEPGGGGGGGEAYMEDADVLFGAFADD